MDGYAIITEYFGEELNIVTPQMLGGYPVREIGSGAFCITYPAESLSISKGVTVICENGISGNVSKIVLPSSLQKISARSFENMSRLETIAFEKAPSDFCTVDGVLYISERGLPVELLYCPRGKAGKLVIPDTVIRIGQDALNGILLDCVHILNSKIEIAESNFKGIKSDFYIQGKDGSKAESYALQRGIHFVSLDEKKDLRRCEW